MFDLLLSTSLFVLLLSILTLMFGIFVGTEFRRFSNPWKIILPVPTVIILLSILLIPFSIAIIGLIPFCSFTIGTLIPVLLFPLHGD